MEKELEMIRDQQKTSWDTFSPGWKKWDSMTMDSLAPVGREIVRRLDLKNTDNVLDIAGGTGEPGLTIASILTDGRVVITDLSDRMLEFAREKAGLRGITNIDIIACDVCELPFEDNRFDAVSCRFGFMFFPDMLQACREIYRTLKPGGKFATSVWNVPEKNFWVTAIMKTINNNLEIPPPKPGAPGMFRCASQDLLPGLLIQAGFKNPQVSEVEGKLRAGTTETYWEMMTEVGAPIVAALSKADDATREKIKKEVFGLLREKYADGVIEISSSALVISAQK